MNVPIGGIGTGAGIAIGSRIFLMADVPHLRATAMDLIARFRASWFASKRSAVTKALGTPRVST